MKDVKYSIGVRVCCMDWCLENYNMQCLKSDTNCLIDSEDLNYRAEMREELKLSDPIDLSVLLRLKSGPKMSHIPQP